MATFALLNRSIWAQAHHQSSQTIWENKRKDKNRIGSIKMFTVN